ncbi:hypothetical protein HELRODRAFT_164771 [Helobdella robusta]|uniref:HAT C-terminal dimerisation domain-containing protein n=1 Tax=Helobdella robusta TaxID=6412 RepID=T1EVS6_HELRO|nr:hypothetical protein HELRODRAFT_164771 [Helobdella robusta]ESN92684.1 hypothetical protein HELRODRAFT_164771 [Helobdella robusta]
MIANKFFGTASLLLSSFALYKFFYYVSGDVIFGNGSYTVLTRSCPTDIWNQFLWKFLFLAGFIVQKTNYFQKFLNYFLDIFNLEKSLRAVNLLITSSLILLNLFYGQIFKDDFFVWNHLCVEKHAELINFALRCFHITSWVLIALAILGLDVFTYVGFISVNQNDEDENYHMRLTRQKNASVSGKPNYKFPGILLVMLMFWLVPGWKTCYGIVGGNDVMLAVFYTIRNSILYGILYYTEFYTIRNSILYGILYYSILYGILYYTEFYTIRNSILYGILYYTEFYTILYYTEFYTILYYTEFNTILYCTEFYTILHYIPSTSTPKEQAFSKSGKLVDIKRNDCEIAQIEGCVCLNDWMELISK